jgi:hypothetical protein
MLRRIHQPRILRSFCKFVVREEEPILPQMIMDLNKPDLEKYFYTHQNILSMESVVYSFETALKFSSRPESLVKDILDFISRRLENENNLFINLTLDLCAKYDIPFAKWMEDLIQDNQDIFSAGLKEKTYIWLLDNVSEESPLLGVLHQQFHNEFSLFIGREDVEQFQNISIEINFDEIDEKFQNQIDQKNMVKDKESLLVLFRIYTTKFRSLDILSHLEIRMALELKYLSKMQLLNVLESCSKLKFRVPNLRLLDLINDYLIEKSNKLNFEDSLRILDYFAIVNYSNNYLLSIISKQLEENFFSKEMLTEKDIKWIGKVVFYLAKLDGLRDDIFETFAELFRSKFEELSSESISYFAFAHSKMVLSKLQMFKSKHII